MTTTIWISGEGNFRVVVKTGADEEEDSIDTNVVGFEIEGNGDYEVDSDGEPIWEKSK